MLHRHNLLAWFQRADDLLFVEPSLADNDLLIRTDIMPKFRLYVVRF